MNGMAVGTVRNTDWHVNVAVSSGPNCDPTNPLLTTFGFSIGPLWPSPGLRIDIVDTRPGAYLMPTSKETIQRIINVVSVPRRDALHVQFHNRGLLVVVRQEVIAPVTYRSAPSSFFKEKPPPRTKQSTGKPPTKDTQTPNHHHLTEMKSATVP